MDIGFYMNNIANFRYKLPSYIEGDFVVELDGVLYKLYHPFLYNMPSAEIYGLENKKLTSIHIYHTLRVDDIDYYHFIENDNTDYNLLKLLEHNEQFANIKDYIFMDDTPNMFPPFIFTKNGIIYYHDDSNNQDKPCFIPPGRKK